MDSAAAHDPVPPVFEGKGFTKLYRVGKWRCTDMGAWTWTSARGVRRAVGPSGSGRSTLLSHNAVMTDG
jgi:hypothetical protein